MAKTFYSEKGSKLTTQEADDNNRFPHDWNNARVYTAGMHVWEYDDVVANPNRNKVQYLVLQTTTAGMVPRLNPLFFKPLGGAGGNDYTKTEPTTETVGAYPAGSTPSGTVQQQLDRILYGTYPPTAGLTLSSPTAGTKEVGAEFSSVTMGATGVRRTHPISKIEYYVGGVLVNTTTYAPASAVNVSDTYVHTFIPALATTTSFQVRVYDDQGGMTSATQTISFSPKRYWGVLADDPLAEPSDSILSGLILLNNSEFGSSKDYAPKEITASGEYIFFAFLDSGTPAFTVNGLPNTAFSGKNFTLTNAEGFAQTYQIFRSSAPLAGTYTIDVN